MPTFMHTGLRSDDCAESIGISTRSDKSSHRTSVFVEHNELPPVWGKDSQPGYKGKRVLGLLPDLHPEGPYANSGPLGAYDPKYIEAARMPRPLDVGYEMPERYGGKEAYAYKEEGIIPLAGNNNSWVPPVAQEKRICGVVRWAFWAVFACICFLIIGGAVGGVLAGVMSSKKAASSKPDSNVPGLLATTSYSTSMSSSTSTSTMGNGDVILVTQVHTAVQTFKPVTTSNPASSTLASGSASSSEAVKSSGTGSATATAMATATATATTTVPASTSSSYNATTVVPPATGTTAIKLANSTPTSSTSGPAVYPLDCPTIDNSVVSTIAGSTPSSYTIHCSSDLSAPSISVVTATSMLECFNACAQYTNMQKTICRGASFNSNLAGGNCVLRGDGGSLVSADSGIAIAILQGGSKLKKARMGRWFHGVVAATE